MEIQKQTWYKAWRRSEAHGVPMTEEGILRAELKAEAFKTGFEYGLKVAATRLEYEHSAVKKEHSFFLRAAQILRGIK
jgi:hypothetical protein